MVLITHVASAAADPQGDTLGVRFELGSITDVTNEQFFADAFIDTVALGRRLVSDPEARYAGLVVATVEGTRSLQATAYRLRSELRIGNKIASGELGGEWRRTSMNGWQWWITPTLSVRRDRTFDRDLDEAKWATHARLRQTPADRSGWLELGANGEGLRTRGEGADFVPDRDVARAYASYERAPLLGPSWNVRYGLTARTFPDSATRDHLEHRVEAGVSQDFLGGHSLELSADVARRGTFHTAPTSKDDFWEGSVAAEAAWTFSETMGLMLRAGSESIRYEREDSTLYFDYDIVRLFVAPQLTGGRWTVRLGPRGELLHSAQDANEAYAEIAAQAEIEWSGARAWWSVAPVAGYRDYDEVPVRSPSSGALDVSAGRSSYAFYELVALGDQTLPALLRLHLYASARLEHHAESTEDARSLYFSFDVRRLF